MKIDYKILWLEDEESWLRVPKKKIEKAIDNMGFIPIIDTISDCNLDNMNYKDYDLILIDYNLDKCTPKQYGNDILADLRSKKLFADAIFYSSSNIDELYSKVKDSKIANVSVMNREIFLPDNISQVIEIIEYFLRKDLDLNSMRGIMMAEVASFDNVIWEIINKLTTENSILENVKEKKEIQKKDFDSLQDADILKYLHSKETSTIYFTSGNRGTFLKNLLKEKVVTDSSYETYLSIMKKYYDEIINERNKLAHREELKADDEEIFINIRQNLIRHRRNIKELNAKQI